MKLKSFNDFVNESKSDEIKVGSTVIPKHGPHKGVKHRVIHIDKDGNYNIKPIGLPASKIKYKLGAASASKSDLELKESQVNEKSQTMEELANEVFGKNVFSKIVDKGKAVYFVVDDSVVIGGKSLIKYQEEGDFKDFMVHSIHGKTEITFRK